MHMAMQIGLHRDPKHLRAISVLQGELRRRLWITILEFVVQSSLDTSMPPRISFDEFDTEPPSNINDEELDESTIMIQPHPKSTFTTMSIQLAMADSLQIRFLIVQALNSLHSEPSYSRVLSLTSALTEALRTSSNVLKDNDSVTPFHRNLLDYLVRRYVIPLNYVYSNQARINPIYRQSLKLSLDAAMAIISPEPDDSFARLIATGGGMFREGIRCALTAVSLELLTHVETQRLDGTLQRAREYRELLKQAVRDLIRLSEERIRLGETNVKSYMFLSMILAQVEAVEAGGPVALQVARSARDSLRLCHDLLRSRADQALFASPADAGSVIEEDGRLDGFGPDFDWQPFLPDAYI